MLSLCASQYQSLLGCHQLRKNYMEENTLKMQVLGTHPNMWI